MRYISIDTKELEYYKKRLEKIGRSDFPLAVRSAVNETAVNMRTQTMPRNFNDNFIIRRKTFLKSQSGTNFCKNTFDINSMISETGISDKLEVGKRLELQEIGGTINNRAIPLDATRRSGNRSKVQKKDFYFKPFKDAKKGTIGKIGNKRIVKGRKGIVLISKKEVKPLYSLDRTISISKSPFVQPAGLDSGANMPEYFVKNAIKRLKK